MSWAAIARWLRVALKRVAYGGRSGEERARVVAWIGPQPGMRIADIGSGLGDFAFDFARAVGTGGVVFAVDTDADLRSAVGREAGLRSVPQVRPIEAREDDARIPERVDLVFLSSTFHHVPDRERYFARLRERLLPGGRIVVLEATPGGFLRLPGHATEPGEIRRVMERAGYRLLAQADLVRGSSLQAFGPASAPPA